MLEALLFDLDGTLLDTDPLHQAIWGEMLAPYGIIVDDALYRQRFSGRLNPQILAELLPALPAAEALALAEAKEAHFRERAGELRPLAGLGALLDWSDSVGLKRALVSNAPRANAEFMLQVLGVAERFPLVVLGEQLPRAKPDPLPYRTALDRLGTRAAHSLAFEDSPAGIRSATGAGLSTVAMATTQSEETLKALGATLVIADFTAPALWTLLGGNAPTER
jgi:beta-phosphoglucomutase